jgi:hypothetical protein
MKLLRWRDRYFRWNYGRQKTGYEVMTFINSRLLQLDLHLIRYRVGDSIPLHRDPAGEGKRHYRLNIEIVSAKEGGALVCKESIYRTKRINLFRPDLSPHAVTEVKQGVRYILSMGWVRKEKKQPIKKEHYEQ